MTPLIHKLPSPIPSPIDLLKFFKDEAYPFLLQSSLVHPQRGRYSFLGFHPFQLFTSSHPQCLGHLREAMALYKVDRVVGQSIPFTGGAVGFLSYDLGLYREGLLRRPREEGQPLAFFGFYDCVIAWDHLTGECFVLSTGLPEKEEGLRQKRARERLDAMVKRLADYRPASSSVAKSVVESEAPLMVAQAQRTAQQYIDSVGVGLEKIAQGDIYQVNLTQGFSVSREACPATPLEVYEALMQASPSLFSAYFDTGSRQLLSSSPEEFLCLRERRVTTRPMKGTRPRHGDLLIDDQLRRELEGSEKERAELLMITDLLRNDLGKVCQPGTISVKEMRTIEAYATVFQAVAQVEGLINPQADAFSVLEACFPGGSVTGCPKIRALAVIEKLEGYRRDLYTGSLGYIDFSGDMQFNILIRTIVADSQGFTFHSGSGIVADSKPESEYQESLLKAKAIQQVLGSLAARGKLIGNR